MLTYEELGISNEAMLNAKADSIGARIAQRLHDIDAAPSPGEDSEGWKLKRSFSFKTSEGFMRDVEITVNVADKPHKIAGGSKWGSSGKKDKGGDDGQMNFLDGEEEDED